MEKYITATRKLQFQPDKKNVLYVGRGGHDMQFALEIFFKAFARGLRKDPEGFGKIALNFVGTSYAPAGQGQATIKPIAERYSVGAYVTEITDRIPYFETLYLLKKADLLLVPGSTDTAYTASKIYPYLLAKKPMLALFYKDSSVVSVLEETKAGQLVKFDHTVYDADHYIDECLSALEIALAADPQATDLPPGTFRPYTAEAKTAEQVEFFNYIISSENKRSGI
jgi:hypothetical protein